MVEAISTEDPASTSADRLGTPTTIPTGIILPFITIHINRMPLPNLPPSPNRSKTLIGNAARSGHQKKLGLFTGDQCLP